MHLLPLRYASVATVKAGILPILVQLRRLPYPNLKMESGGLVIPRLLDYVIQLLLVLRATQRAGRVYDLYETKKRIPS